MAVRSRNTDAGTGLATPYKELYGNWLGLAADGLSFDSKPAITNADADFTLADFGKLLQFGAASPYPNIRTSVQLSEVTIRPYKTTMTAGTITLFALFADATAARVAGVTIPASTPGTTGYTTRDGSLKYYAAYQDPSSRVFAPGVCLAFGFDDWDAGEFGAQEGLANAADIFGCLLFAPEYGAPPN